MRCALFVFLSAALLVQPDPAQPEPGPERFAAVMAAGPLNAQPRPIEIGVDRWSTDDTRASLYDLWRTGGLGALRDAVKKAGAAGYVKMANHERLAAGYVQQEPRPGGGRRILMLCARFPGDWEVTRDSGWTDHVFRVVALTLDRENHGSGMLFHTAKITFEKDGPDLLGELSGQPARLLSVQKVR